MKLHYLLLAGALGCLQLLELPDQEAAVAWVNAEEFEVTDE
jgi:hypothetical protein